MTNTQNLERMQPGHRVEVRAGRFAGQTGTVLPRTGHTHRLYVRVELASGQRVRLLASGLKALHQ